MIRRLFMLVVWLSIGYYVGFQDARQHDRSVVGRTMDRFRGIARQTYERQRDVLKDAAGDMIEAAADEVLPPARQRTDSADAAAVTGGQEMLPAGEGGAADEAVPGVEADPTAERGPRSKRGPTRGS